MLGTKPLADIVATISPLLSMLSLSLWWPEMNFCTFWTLRHESHVQGHHGPLRTQISQGSTNWLVSRHGSCMLLWTSINRAIVEETSKLNSFLSYSWASSYDLECDIQSINKILRWCLVRGYVLWFLEILKYSHIWLQIIQGNYMPRIFEFPLYPLLVKIWISFETDGYQDSQI